MLSAHDVLNQKFSATKFREGYDQDEVDAFLDRVMTTLQGLERGESVPGAVTAQDVGSVTFQSTKFREGYDQAEVDRFLDRVRDQLAAPVPQDAPVRLPSGGPAVSATALVLRVQSAHSARLPGAPDAVSVRLPDGQVRPVVDVRGTPAGVELVLG